MIGRPTLIILVFLLTLCGCANKKSERTVVMDSADLLTQPQKDSITLLITNLEKEIGSQLAIIIIKTLDGRDINQYSHDMFERYKFGRASYNDGLLITIAVEEKMARIEVGYGLENIVRDEISGKFLREIINPHFRNGQYGKGLYITLDSIKHRIVANQELIGTEPTWPGRQ